MDPLAALSAVPAQLSQLVEIVRAIRDALDLGSHLERAIADAVIAPLRAGLRYLIETTAIQDGAPFTADATIRHFEPLAQAVADAGLAVVVMWAFYRVMFAHGSFTQYTARIMIPRFVVAAVAIQFALPLFQGAIDFENALSTAVFGASTNVDLRHMVETWNNEASPEPGLGPLVAIALLVGFLLLTIVYAVRYALLVVLAVLAPVAALLMVLPDTQKYAREWVSLFIPTLLMQPLQLLVLGIGLSLEATGKTPIRHAFALAALWMCFKVPGALRTAGSVGSHAESVVHSHLNKLAKAAARL